MNKHTYINCPYCGQKLIRLGADLLDCQMRKDGTITDATVNDTYWCDRCVIDISIVQEFFHFDTSYLKIENG